MHDRRQLAEQRIERFLRERLSPALYRAHAPLTIQMWRAPGEPVSFAEAVGAPFAPFEVGSPWGAAWGTSWFTVTGEIPADWAGLENTQPELVVDLGFNTGQSGFQAEALVYRPDGSPIKGISPFNNAVPGAVDPHGRIDVLIEAAGNPDVGSDFSFTPMVLGDRATAGAHDIYTMRRLDVGLLDLTVWNLLADTKVLDGLMRELPVDSPRRAQLQTALEAMIDAVDPSDVAGTAARGRAVLAPVLAKKAHESAHLLHATGHAHIDSAWLWPVRETVRKCSRTFSNMVDLMDEHPDFTFSCSSAQQYAWIKEFHPSLFARIKEKVAAGQFIPVGGMWVESDTNLPGGEALARQFVAGKSFFLDEFGVENEEVWLPDSFGYSGAVPQIAVAAGMRYFLTQKISWNETNVMPHHSFRWEGIDGTRIFTHFPPVDKYNSDLNAADLAHAERNYADDGRGTMSLLPYGYGDGGGGPTREMLATVARTTDLEGSPRVVPSTPQKFFADAEAEYPEAEVWKGELYLELHRGTYTSQRHTKKGNRRSEHLLREAELWATTATVRAGTPYPADELKHLWQLVLLQQFHDILPGSSIAWVHQDAERNYAYIEGELEAIIADSVRALAGAGSSTLLLNAAPHARLGVPALGAGVAETVLVTPVPDGDEVVFDNGAVRARFDAAGLLVSLVDVATGRDAVPPGHVGNLFQLHRDTPTQWDAWDVDAHYRNTVTDLRTADRVEIDGDVLIVERSFGASTLTQRISLGVQSPTLDFAIEIDWHERQKLLKLAFPLDLHSDTFASEIQFGHIQRASHTNTSWDAARFEVSAHRWIHVTEPDFGVAIVNDSTYGHDVTRTERAGGGSISIARLSILRAALFPDPEQDQGRHELHVGVVVGAAVVDAVVEGYRANLPERRLSGLGVDEIAPLITVSNPGVVVEAVKLAEDGSGDVVVRLYEALGQRAVAEVGAGFPAGGVIATDLLERELDSDRNALRRQGSAAGKDGATLSLRPFELVTLRFRR